MPARLAQLLVARGLLPAERVEALLRHHQAQGGLMDSTVLELGLAREPDVLEFLGEVSGHRPVNLADFEPNAEVASFIPPKVADRLCAVPLSLDGNTLHVACGHPVPKKELEEVGFLLGKPLELWVAVEARVREWISTIYRQPLAPRFSRLSAALAAGAAPAQQPPPPPPPDESLTPDMVERLARSVAAEPLPIETTRVERPAPAQPAAPKPSPQEAAPRLGTPGAPVPPPAYTREPLRLNMGSTQPQAAKPAAATPPAAPQETAPRLGTPGAPVPPPAYTREPLRLNMGPAQQAAKPAATAQPPSRPAAAPPAAPQPATAPQTAARPAQPQAMPQPAGAATHPAQPQATTAPQAPVAQPSAAQQPPARPPQASAPQPVAAQPRPAAQQPRPPEPQFLVFSNPAPPVPPPRARPQPEAPAAAAPAPQRPPAPPPQPAAQTPPPPPAPDIVPDWTLAQARSALKEAAKDRDKLIDVALRFARRTFDYVASFAVLRGAAAGWEARGEGLTGEPLSQVSIPLDAGSIFRTVAVTRGSYAGPLPPDALTKHYLELFGRQSPRTVFLYPVEVRGRLVAILYGDCGQKPISQRRLSDYILFCQDLPAAFQELILFRKQRLNELRAQADFDVDVELPGAAPAPAPAAVAGLGWSAWGSRTPSGLGRAAAMPPRVMSQEERPPPDFAPLLKRLTGPDAAQRSSAMAEFARSPEASARVLAQHFPGPTAWSRLPVVELPEADELGPIPAALSRLGRPGAQALSPLLESQDADTRYFALLTAGNLPYVDLADGVLRGLFDDEPDISSAARVAAASLKHLPRFDSAKKELRQELAGRDGMRRSLAARALGALHDRDSIEGLILVLGGDDEMCAQAASEALREIARGTFGTNVRQWNTWWVENRNRRRADWLVAALRHKELDVRLAALEELSRAINDTLGYLADAPEAEREAAVRRWEAAAADPARARRLAML
ncbi:FrgA protein [Myxococcaceae bacterium GXIMD 01537]